MEPLVDFKLIESPILVETLNSTPDIILKDLSNDHRIAIGLCKLLVFGVDMDQISHLKMGPVVKSRFVTLEMQVLRLYCNTLDPAPDLQRLARYLVQVYFPIFLLSRRQYRSFQAPALLLKETQLCREHLSKGDLDKMQKCLSRNGFWSHPENITLALLNSSYAKDRREGVRIVREKRVAEGPSKSKIAVKV